MKLDRYDIFGTSATCGWTAEQTPDGDWVQHADVACLFNELSDTLRSARVYVRDAYECAFPDGAQNDRVLAAIDAALSKLAGGAA